MIAAAHYSYTGDCPSAELVTNTVLVIPCNYALRGDDVERTARRVNRAWTEVADRGRGIGLWCIPAGATAPPQT